jgi:hypothetical protein
MYWAKLTFAVAFEILLTIKEYRSNEVILLHFLEVNLSIISGFMSILHSSLASYNPQIGRNYAT